MADDLAHTILIELSRLHVDCLQQYNPAVKAAPLAREDAPAMSQMVGMAEARTWNKPRVFALYRSNLEHDLTWLKPVGIVKITPHQGVEPVVETIMAGEAQHASIAERALKLWNEKFSSNFFTPTHAAPSKILDNLGVKNPESFIETDRVAAILSRLGIRAELSPAMRSL